MIKDDRKTAVEKSKTHWEIDVSNSVFPKKYDKKQFANYNSNSPKNWPRTHVKINETDY